VPDSGDRLVRLLRACIDDTKTYMPAVTPEQQEIDVPWEPAAKDRRPELSGR
jgi:hypothetical protein